MNILILGVSGVQTDLLKILSQKHTVHALSYKAEGVGREYADYFAVIDIKDKEAVLDYAKRHNCDLVYSVGSDLGMITSAWVSQQMQLPSFVSYDVAKTCHKKNLLRKKLEHVRGSIEYKVITSPSGIGCVQFPRIIKPIDSQGQRGVFLVRNQDELEQKFSESLKFSKEGKVIAERYIEGPEVSVNTYMIDGEIHFNVISDRIVWPQYQTGIIHKHRIPSQFVNAESKRRISRLISDIAKEIGLKNGPLYSQIKLEDNEPKLIEITPRLDGCHLWRLIKHATGVDLLETTINHLMGQDFDKLSTDYIEERWVLEFMCEKPGNRVNTHRYDVDEARFHEWYYENGAVVKPINNLLEKCGYKIFKPVDWETAPEMTKQTLSEKPM